MKSIDLVEFEAPSIAATVSIQDITRTDNRTEAGQGTDIDPDKTFTFADVSQLLDVNESTLRRRWWAEKIEPAFQHCPTPLRVKVRETRSGSPVYEFTVFGLQVFGEYKSANEQERGDRYLDGIRVKYPAPEVEQMELIEPEPIEDEPEVKPGALARRESSSIARFSEMLSEFDIDLEADEESVSLTLEGLDEDLAALDDIEEQLAFKRGIQKELRLAELEAQGRAAAREKLLKQKLGRMGKPAADAGSGEE